MPQILFMEPDWSSAPVEIELTFVTEIENARRGDEQRTPGRQTPSRTLRYSANPFGAGELASFRKARAASGGATGGGSGGSIVTGLWTDGVQLTAAVVAGGATVLSTTSTAARRFVNGQQCIVFAGPSKISLASITAVGANSITVSAMDQAFAAGDRVFPAFVAEPLGQSPTGNSAMITDQMGAFSLQLAEFMDQVLPAAAGADWSSYLGFPLFTVPLPAPDWTSAPADAATYDVARNALGYGRRELVDRGFAERVTQSFQVQAINAADALRIESFFRDRLGRCKAFWWPDLVPLANVTAVAGSTLTLKSVGYATYFAPLGLPRIYLAIVDQGGVAHPYKITGVVDNGDGTETYTLDAAVGLTVGQIARVSFLLLVRLDQDVLVLQYITDQIATARLSVLEVPLEVPA